MNEHSKVNNKGKNSSQLADVQMKKILETLHTNLTNSKVLQIAFYSPVSLLTLAGALISSISPPNQNRT
jgi:hypothetical protein